MPIKTLEKPKKKKKSSYWSGKCDRLIQETGREIYKDCLVCNKEMSCLHHFYPKSQSTHLRYNWNNLIPICVKCHFAHHNGNPEIHARVIEIMGQDWYRELSAEKRKHLYTKVGYVYFERMFETLTLLKPIRIKAKK